MSNQQSNDQQGAEGGRSDDAGQPADDQKPPFSKRVDDWLYRAAAVYTLGGGPETVDAVLQAVIEGLRSVFGFAMQGVASAEQIPWLLGELGQVPELVVDLRDELLRVADDLPRGGQELEDLVRTILATSVSNQRVRIRNDAARAAVREWILHRQIPGSGPTAPGRPR